MRTGRGDPGWVAERGGIGVSHEELAGRIEAAFADPDGAMDAEAVASAIALLDKA